MKLTNCRFRSHLLLASQLLLRGCTALVLLLSLSHCAQLSAPDAAPEAADQMTSRAEPQQQPAEHLSEQQHSPGQITVPVTEPGLTAPVTPKPELQPELAQQFEQAKQSLRKNDYRQAITLLEPLAQQLPDAPGIHYNLAVAYWQLQQTERALRTLTPLLERRPDYVEAANLLGVIARQQGNFNQARRYWLEALAQRSDFASAHKNLGFLYELYLAQPEQARHHYQQYQKLTGDPMAEAWLRLLEQQE